ncbi:4-hydroxy-tetrahydrodipicolinate synthase [Gammaproteobacteria bacterium AH-315-M22]|nr:4-hydroxy-tetrahydrodipicolinate synthase [Gammaproteobacteria bacterium AH-315-M22]
MFQGSMVALVTPMADDGAVDYSSLQALVEWHVQAGTNAIVAVGTTGESATLDETEHCDVIRHVVQYVDGRIPVIAGTGANSTREAIDLSRCAQQVGADACLLVTPYYNKPTQEGLYQHHKLIAESVAIPQILYNVPGRTACDMLPETIARLAKIDNIVGVKEATGDLSRLDQIRLLTGNDFAIYSGDDETGTAFMLQGGNGVISVTNNVAPEAMAAMCKAALAGDIAEAEKIDQSLSALHKELFIESNPIPVKWALHRMGKIASGIRLPMTSLDKKFHAVVETALEQAGIELS